MNRKTTLATVTAATAAFAATVVASISIMQATVSVSASDELPLAAAAITTPSAGPSFTPEPLPELPILDAESEATTNTPSSPSAAGVEASQASFISQDTAVAAVLQATKGNVTKIESMVTGTTNAFAITVKRSDGSIVTAYVDRNSGNIYEWVINKKASQPAMPTKEYEDDDDHGDDEHEEDDDHEDDDHEDDDDERDSDDD